MVINDSFHKYWGNTVEITNVKELKDAYVLVVAEKYEYLLPKPCDIVPKIGDFLRLHWETNTKITKMKIGEKTLELKNGY
jgi:hypothetical protein